jgi:hypothetical protein
VSGIVYDNPGMAFLEGPRVTADVDQWHQLIADKGYGKCSCGVGFQWGRENYLPQFLSHREERLIAAVAAAVRAERPSRRVERRQVSS